MATKTGRDAINTASNRVVQKQQKQLVFLVSNKIAETITIISTKSRNVNPYITLGYMSLKVYCMVKY